MNQQNPPDDYDQNQDPYAADAADGHEPADALVSDSWDQEPIDALQADEAAAHPETLQNDIPEDGGENAAPAAAEPRKNYLPLIAGAVVLLGAVGAGGYFAYQQFLAPKPAAQPMPAQAIIAEMAAPKMAAAGLEDAATAPTADMPPEVVNMPAAPAATSPFGELAPAANSPVAAPTVEPITSPAPTANPIAATNAEPVPAVSAETPAVVPAPAPELTPEAPNVMAPVAVAPSAEVVGLRQQVSELQAVVGQLQNELTTMRSAPTAASAPDTAALQARLAKLEQQLAARGSAAASKPTTNRPVASTRSANQRTPAQTSKAAKTAREQRPHSPSTTSSLALPGSSSVAVPEFYLRSAMPGQAMISRSPRGGELLSVSVGDQLPELGTIRAIRQVDGRWQVEGTSGMVR